MTANIWRPIAYVLGITFLLGAILLRLHLTGPTWFPVGNLRIFYYLIIEYDFPAFILFVAIFFAAPWLRKILPLKKIVDFLSDKLLECTCVFFALLCVGAVFVYQNFPLCMDEYSVKFQAEVFANGKLWGELPPELARGLIPNGSDNPFFRGSDQSGYFIAKYWWGYSLLLAPFVYLGIPWALNPLLGAATLLLLGHMARKIFPDDKDASGWVALMAFASPQFVVTSISYYSMPAHLFFNLLYAALLLDPKPGRVFAAGLVGGAALCLHNPFPHAVFAVPWIIWLLWRPDRFRNLAMLGLGYIPLFAIIGGGYLLTKAHVIAPSAGVTAAIAQDSSPGFERILALFAEVFRSVKPPSLGLVWVRLLNAAKLWFWSAPGIVVLAVIGAFRCRRNLPLLLLAWSGITTLLAMFFFHGSQGHGWGHRYFHFCWGILPLLAMGFIAPRCGSGESFTDDSRQFLAQLFGVCCVLSLVFCNAQRLWQVHDHITRHRSVVPSVNKALPHVVFVPRGFYTLDLVQNDPFFHAPTIRLPSRGPDADRKFMRDFFSDAQPVDPRGLAWALTKHPREYLEAFRARIHAIQSHRPKHSP